MTHRDPPSVETAGTLALFPSEAAWATMRILDAQPIDTADFDLEALARYRRIQILTYSSSIRMLHTVLERFAESSAECVLGSSRAVNIVASIIALQTAAMGVGNGRTGGAAIRCRLKCAESPSASVVIRSTPSTATSR